jgi:hypothetical protein
LQDTLALADAAGLRTHLLAPWYDIDTMDELLRLRVELEVRPDTAPQTARFLQTYRFP